LTKGLVTHDLPAREEDGEDFDDPDGQADPIDCERTD
jgi:hypothetical protein